MKILPLLTVGIAVGSATTPPPHIVIVVADDLGRNDLSHFNGGLSHTPAIDSLIANGVELDSYYTFKVCAPSRTSIMTGRYPWRTGYYDMNNDDAHCVHTNYTMLGDALKRRAAYKTHAIGKWDIGKIGVNCTATWRGFDSFLGYYSACNQDYFLHNGTCQDKKSGNWVQDLSLNTNDPATGAHGVAGVAGARGTYSTHVYTQRAVSLVKQHAAAHANDGRPLFLYLAYQNVHLACGAGKNKDIGPVQAPCSTVDRFANMVNDTYKAQAANMYELDMGVGNVTQALRDAGMWNNTVLWFVSDNGGPLDHTTNFPLRGGKHTFWEGGTRVVSFLAGGLLPQGVRGTKYNGILHSSDLYPTLLEGAAGAGSGAANASSPNAPTAVDGFNAWLALTTGGASPRNEVVHQARNGYFNDSTTGYAIRVGDYKLITGDPGDSRVLAWPQPLHKPVAFGASGGHRDDANDACRAPSGKGDAHGHSAQCVDTPCLFNVVEDPSESVDLAANESYATVLARLQARWVEVSRLGPSTDIAYPYGATGAIVQTREQASCTAALQSGYWEPPDAPVLPPAPTPAPPVPTPPPPPTPPTPLPQDGCAAAGGVRGMKKKNHDDTDVCCAASCGTCGGSGCNKRPGGGESCCAGKVRAAGKPCRTGATIGTAPCVLDLTI